MIVLGIDPGTTCGWAVLDVTDRTGAVANRPAGKLLASGRWDLKPRGHEGAGMRYVRLQSYLTTILEEFKFSVVAYEQPGTFGGQSKASPEVIHGVVATVQAWLERRKIPYQGLAFASSKKLATGTGTASKILMCQAARRLYGVSLYAGKRVLKATASRGELVEHDHDLDDPSKTPRRGKPGDEDEADAILVAHACAITVGPALDF